MLYRSVESAPVGLLKGRHVEILDRAEGKGSEIEVFVVHATVLRAAANAVLHVLEMAILAESLL